MGASLFYVCFRYVLPWCLPFLLALLVAALLEPVVLYLRRKFHFQRGFSALILTLTLLFLLGGLLSLLWSTLLSQTNALLAAAPAFFDAIPAAADDLLSRLEQFSASSPEWLSGYLHEQLFRAVTDADSLLRSLSSRAMACVRDKLRMAQLAVESHPEFKVNVDVLTKAQPKDLEASEIDVRLGATWLDPAIVQQFMLETFQPPYQIRYNNAITVHYSPYTSEWRIFGKSATGSGDIMATETYGTRSINAYKILEDTLNLRDSRVYDIIEEDGKEKRVLNQHETTLAQQKQQAIKDAFAGWVWKDPQRRALLVKQYNELPFLTSSLTRFICRVYLHLL